MSETTAPGFPHLQVIGSRSVSMFGGTFRLEQDFDPNDLHEDGTYHLWTRDRRRLVIGPLELAAFVSRAHGSRVFSEHGKHVGLGSPVEHVRGIAKEPAPWRSQRGVLLSAHGSKVCPHPAVSVARPASTLPAIPPEWLELNAKDMIAALRDLDNPALRTALRLYEVANKNRSTVLAAL